jgi:hypothetical protein
MSVGEMKDSKIELKLRDLSDTSRIHWVVWGTATPH